MKSSRSTLKYKNAKAPVRQSVAKPTNKENGKKAIVMVGQQKTKAPAKLISHEKQGNESCYVLSDTTQQSRNQKRRTGFGKEEPNPTTFSNARKFSYLDATAPVKGGVVLAQDLKISDRSTSTLQNKMSQNFSATQRLQTHKLHPEAISNRPTAISGVPYSKQSIADQLSRGVKTGLASTMMGSTITQRQQEMIEYHEGLTGSSEESVFSGIDEGDTDISMLLACKMAPPVVNKFLNIYASRDKPQHTLDRILEEGEKQQQEELKTNALLSTQAQTFFMKTKQSSPVRLLGGVVLSKLPSKILYTVSVSDITSNASQFNRISESSHPYVDCSVPDIVSNSTITEALLINQSANRISLCSKYLRQGSIVSDESRCEGPPVTANSCLRASYKDLEPSSNYSSSSCGSLLQGENNSQSCSCCHNNSNTLKSQLQSRFMINLETVLLQEVKLWELYQHFRQAKENWTSQELMQLCEEWWTITKESACLFDLYKIYRDASTRKILRRAMILECTLLVLTAFFIQHEQNIPQLPKDSLWLVKHLARLFQVVHQNMLHIVCLVLQRMGLENCDQNVWAVTLRETVMSKIALPKSVPSENALLMDELSRNELLAKNNYTIVKQIKKIQVFHEKRVTQSILFTNVSFVIQEIEKTHINRVKEILIQALNHECAQFHSQQQHASWQEYPVGELECDESIQLPASPQEHQIIHNNLSTINEDCSYYSATPQQSSLKPPYLPPKHAQDDRYTLVLDLDETLIHYVETSSSNDDSAHSQGGQFLVRPGVHKFLREMSQYYEIVIFTAAMQDYADWVLDQLDFEHCISYRLYRQHALPAGQFFIKDLSRIGRDLNTTLIVDNVAENFQLQPDNGVFIRTWIDDPKDNALEELAPLLKEIVVKGVADVREALRIFRLQMMDQVQRGILKPRLSLDFAVLNPEAMERSQKRLKSMLKGV